MIGLFLLMVGPPLCAMHVWLRPTIFWMCVPLLFGYAWLIRRYVMDPIENHFGIRSMQNRSEPSFTRTTWVGRLLVKYVPRRKGPGDSVGDEENGKENGS